MNNVPELVLHQGELSNKLSALYYLQAQNQNTWRTDTQSVVIETRTITYTQAPLQATGFHFLRPSQTDPSFLAQYFPWISYNPRHPWFSSCLSRHLFLIAIVRAFWCIPPFLFFLFFNVSFWNNYKFTGSCNTVYREGPNSLPLVSSSGNILHNCSELLQPGI